jgi:hypothetical protein
MGRFADDEVAQRLLFVGKLDIHHRLVSVPEHAH